jgi:5-hydroxyisourate hydrolase-like protein (transthyretin family)
MSVDNMPGKRRYEHRERRAGIMKKWLLGIIGTLLFATGCGSEEQSLQPPVPIEVELNIQPAEPTAEQHVTFSVTVKQNGTTVNDADEVELEFWKDGQEQHETIPTKKTGDGVYSAEKSFAEPGTYYVMYHVTARDFHSMAKREFAVKGDQPDSHESGGHHHGKGVDFHFEPATTKVNQSTKLTVHIIKDNQPLTQATVKFEYWKNGDKKHQFIDAGEGKAGEYTAQAVLSSPGEYTIKIHLEKGDIHDHKEYPLSVQ